jgi:amino acid adenylation domain-containing protein
VVANPDQAIDDVAILTATERRTLVDDWNARRATRFSIRPVHRLFEMQVERTPDRVAVVCNGERLTYAELNMRANRLAHHLCGKGAGAESPVGIVLDRSVDAVVGVLAVLKAGGAYVPLDPNYPSERQAFVLRDAGARLIITEQRLFDRFPELFLQIDDAGAVPARLCIDTDAAAIAAERADNIASDGPVDALAYVIYTSGSTGRPKGTMITHAALANAFFAWQDAYGLRDRASAHLQMASISFDVFSGDLVRALCSGGKLVLAPQDHLFSPSELYGLMRDEQVDCAEFVPAVVRDLLKYLDDSGQSLDFMRLMIVGSDSWYASEYASIRERCSRETRVINSYGVSEATIDSTFFETGDLALAPDARVPIGRGFANAEIYVLDARLQLVPIGVPGELCIGGPGLARGYLNRPDLTAEKFVPHPFAAQAGERLYRTGDLARFLPDGNVELLGRIDDQVKLRGFRIEVGEIEAVLTQHEAVAQSVVVLREDVPGDKRLVAYVVAAPDQVVEAPELRRFLREKLPEYMVPSAVVELAAVPLLPNGKVNRRGLPPPEGQRQSAEAYVAPANEIERGIADVWKELLRLDTVGVHDNFFDLGGHSLLVIQLHSRLRTKLSLELTVLDLFVHPTIHALAAKLDDRNVAETVEFDLVRERAAKQREAMKRRRVSSETREVSR